MFGLRSARARAILTGAVVTLLLAAIAGVAVWRADSMRERHQSLEHASVVVASLEHADARFHAGQATLATLVWRPDPTLVDTYQEAAAEVDEALALARTQALSAGKEGRAASIDHLAGQVNQLREQVEAAIPTVLNADPDEAVQIATTVMPEAWSGSLAVRVELDGLVSAVQDDLRSERAAADRAADATLWLLIGLSTVAFIGGGTALGLLVASVLRPLRSLQTSVRSITSGDLEARTKVSGPEELASLARDFNEMVTERRRAEEALRASEQRLHTVVTNAPVVLFAMDSQGIFTFLEGKGLDSLGLKPGSVVGQSIFELRRATPRMRENTRRALAGEAFTTTAELAGMVLETRLMPLRNGNGTVVGVIGVATDITGRRRAEKALRESEAKYRHIFESVQDIVFRTDLEGTITEASPSVDRYGYTREQLIGTPVLEVYENPEDRQAHVMALLEHGEVVDYELRLKAGDGRVVHASTCSHVCRDADGSPIGFEGTIRDITERKRAEEALRESEERVRRLSEATLEGIVIHDGALILDANQQAAAMFGYELPEIMGADPLSFVAPESRDIVRQHIATGYDDPYEVSGLRRNGTVFPMEVRGKALAYEGREARVGVVQDLTERKRAEEALRASEARYRFLAEHAQDVIVFYSLLPEPHHEYVSPSAEAVMGYTPDDFYADPGLAVRITHPEDVPLFAEYLRSPSSWGARPLVLRRLRKDGSMIWTEERTSAVFSEDGDLVATIAVIRDVSERIRSEEGVEKLRSEFLGMVSHELKTPLTAIKGSAATALGSPTPLSASGYRELFEIVDEQADRLRCLADDMLDMTRIETGTLPVSPEPVALAGIIEEARTVLLHSDGSHPLDIQVPVDLPPVNADRQRTVQVITNLLNNAAQCSPPTAPIEVRVEHDAVQVTVHVRDHGRGIPPDRLPDLFRKFSQLPTESGRRPGGAGLGLAISKGIIESQGGRIWAESAGEGQGATFSFTLPVAAEGAPALEKSTVQDAMIRRRGERTRVLAVDDEPQVLRYLKRSLETAGHEALLTGDPAEVAELVEAEEPDVVLLDLRLPGSSGFQVLRQVRQFSTVPIIFLTASDRDEDVVRALDMGADDYMKKPFSPSELLARIKVALRRRAIDEGADLRRPFVLGDLTIDFTERRVFVKDRPANLSATEYKLLLELATHAGRVLTHQQILQRVWGPDYSGETDLVRSFIRNLRRKLGDDARRPRFIFTEPQVGYRMPRPL